MSALVFADRTAAIDQSSLTYEEFEFSGDQLSQILMI